MGAVLCVVLMFGMNPSYATASLLIMVGIHAWVSRHGGGQKGMVRLFRGIIFQMQRALQLALQMSDEDDLEESTGWRPFVLGHFAGHLPAQRKALTWCDGWPSSHGFGTYMHFIQRIPERGNPRRTPAWPKQSWSSELGGNKSRVHLDTIISPSYTSAIAQCIQLPGISGKGQQLVSDGVRPRPSRQPRPVARQLLLACGGRALDLALFAAAAGSLATSTTSTCGSTPKTPPTRA